MIKRWEGDHVTIEVEVLDVTESPVDITGATLAGAAKRKDSVVSGTVEIIDAAGGLFEVSFAAGALAPGRWKFQARVTLNDEPRVVYEDTILVRVAHV